MRKLLFSLLIVVGILNASVQDEVKVPVQLTPLVEVADLQALLTTTTAIQLVDIRSPQDFAAGHLPNAVSAPYGKWRGPASNPGKLVAINELEQLVGSLGLRTDLPVVVYATGEDTTDFGAAARVYWTLKYLGFDNLSLLNGGFKHWRQNLAPVETQVQAIQPVVFQAQVRSDLVILQEELVERLAEQSSSFQLIDSRPQAFYLGQQKAPMATLGGTIAGAQSSAFGQWFNSYDTRLRPTTEIMAIIQQQGIDQAQETVSFCNTGHWAATNWFVFSEIAQLPSARLYPESMTGWTQSKQALPMDNTPSRWQQIKTKFSQLGSK